MKAIKNITSAEMTLEERELLQQLYFYIGIGDMENAKAMIHQDAHDFLVHASDSKGWGVLHQTVFYSEVHDDLGLEMLDVLISKGADVEKEATVPEGFIDKGVYAGATALHFAAGAGYLEMVKKLIEAGADFNKISKSGKTLEWLATPFPEVLDFIIAIQKASIEKKELDILTQGLVRPLNVEPSKSSQNGEQEALRRETWEGQKTRRAI